MLGEAQVCCDESQKAGAVELEKGVSGSVFVHFVPSEKNLALLG